MAGRMPILAEEMVRARYGVLKGHENTHDGNRCDGLSNGSEYCAKTDLLMLACETASSMLASNGYDARAGDTITDEWRLGYRLRVLRPRSGGFCGLFPDTNDFNVLRDALEKLSLNDRLVVEAETSPRLDLGFVVGFWDC